MCTLETWAHMTNLTRSHKAIFLQQKGPKLTCRHSIAGRERVTLITRVAPTVGIVIVHRACGVDPAHPGARIHTLLIYAGKGCGTLLFYQKIVMLMSYHIEFKKEDLKHTDFIVKIIINMI